MWQKSMYGFNEFLQTLLYILEPCGPDKKGYCVSSPNCPGDCYKCSYGSLKCGGKRTSCCYDYPPYYYLYLACLPLKELRKEVLEQVKCLPCNYIAFCICQYIQFKLLAMCSHIAGLSQKITYMCARVFHIFSIDYRCVLLLLIENY